MLCSWVRTAVIGSLVMLPAGAGDCALPEHRGAWQAAFLSESPYEELWEAGIMLPPTRADVQKLSAVEFLRRQSAIKRVLLARNVRTYAEHKRLSDENLLASAQLADELKAPRELAHYFRMLASDTLGNRRRYMVLSALEALLNAYLVDELQIRYFVELSALSEQDLATLWDWLPLASCFNMVSVQKRQKSEVEADYHLLKQVYSRLHSIYASVKDHESANAAAAQALESLVLHESTAYTRLYASPELKESLPPHLVHALILPATSLQKERIRLRENDYFGSLRLRLLDLLLG